MDLREAILARLAEVLAGVPGITTAERNAIVIDDEMCPVIMLLDADEIAIEVDERDKRPVAPFRVVMTPQIYLKVSGKSETQGPAINALRAATISAVMTDGELISLVNTTGSIRFVSCATGFAAGRSLQGEMHIAIAFTYVLSPHLL